MNSIIAITESKIYDFVQRRESEWEIVCGLKTTSYDEMLKILQLLRNEGLYELEAMLVWKMEYLELKED